MSLPDVPAWFKSEDYPFSNVNEGEYHLVQGLKPGWGENPGVRLELRDLKADADLWNLYLLGLHYWQRLPEDHHYSWVSVNGIHGYPYSPWPPSDKSLYNVKNNTNYNATFCTHTSVLFLSWHRPYLALYEEILYKIIQIVANKFTWSEGGMRYQEAAKRFRMPFWDFARQDRPRFPEEVIASDKVTVQMPAALRELFYHSGGKMDVEIHNPLYSYKWHYNTPEGYKIHGKNTTVRWDRENEWDPEGDGADPAVVKSRVEGNMRPYDSGLVTHGKTQVQVEGNLTERVVYLLQAYDRFYQFTSNSFAGPDKEVKEPVQDPNDHSVLLRGGGYGSLEDIHNTMHDLCGGSGNAMDGHMAQVERSSFDPIFWLLHANVDRLWALWQALHDNPDNPYAYVTPQRANDDFGGHWVVKPGDEQNAETPLPPFYEAEGKLWDSNGVRQCSTFGYCYPETQEWKFSDRNAYKQHVQTQISTLYSSGSLANMIMRKKWTGTHEDEDRIWERAKLWLSIQKSGQNADTFTWIQMNKATTESAPASSSWEDAYNQSSFWNNAPKIDIPQIDVHDHPNIEDLAAGGYYSEWMFNIAAEKHALNGRYEVHVFLGPVAEDNPHLFSTSPNHVGTFAPLGQSTGTGCDKCRMDQASHQKITGQIPLTIALVERIFAKQDLTTLGHWGVVPYLQKELHWEVVDQSGNRLSTGRNAVAGLQVSVTSNDVQIPDFWGSPEYSDDVRVWPDATTLPNGYGRAEETGTTMSNLWTWQT